MSKADKMFDDLSYDFKTKTDRVIVYENYFGDTVRFWLSDRNYDLDADDIKVSLHLAIHEKMKELGWI